MIEQPDPICERDENGKLINFRMALPIPPIPLSPNWKGGHWAKKARAIKKYRRLSATVASMQLKSERPMWSDGGVVITFYHKTARFRDRDNIQSSLKAAFDGLVDAGVLVDDLGLTVHPPIRLKDAENPRVELKVSRATETLT